MVEERAVQTKSEENEESSDEDICLVEIVLFKSCLYSQVGRCENDQQSIEGSTRAKKAGEVETCERDY